MNIIAFLNLFANVISLIAFLIAVRDFIKKRISSKKKKRKLSFSKSTNSKRRSRKKKKK